MALLSAVAGAVVDRVDRRVLLLRLQLVNLVLSSLLAYAVVTRIVTPGFVQLVAVAMGTSQAFEMPCRQAFVADAVPREHLRNAVALNSAMINLALVLGPSLAGLLISTIGIAACFVFDAASFLAIIVVLWRVRLPVRAPRPPAGPMGALLLGGVRYVRRSGDAVAADARDRHGRGCSCPPSVNAR
jgi:MFS family permease